jgi:hypothetical protein
VSELVRHHRQELRLRSVRRLGVRAGGLLCREETRPLDRLRAPLSERARERHVTSSNERGSLKLKPAIRAGDHHHHWRHDHRAHVHPLEHGREVGIALA